MKLFEKPETARRVGTYNVLRTPREMGWMHEWAASTNEAAVRNQTDSIRRVVEDCVLWTR